jgi:uncharacterized protein YcbK (DUF882 family)
MADLLARRTFLALGAATVTAVGSTPALAKIVKPHARGPGHGAHHVFSHLPATPRTPINRPPGDRFVHVVNIHTKESLQAVYFQNGQYLPAAMHQISHVMRDHLSGEIHPMDPELMDLLGDLRQTLGVSEPFSIISGYRSPRTNAWMVRTEAGVARNSLHMKGQAVDIALAGHETATLQNAALRLAEGGVGYYPRSGFVHVDTGKVRQWRFG